jgi:catalase
MSDRHETHSSAPLLTSTTGAPLADPLEPTIAGHAGCCNQHDYKDDDTQLGISFRLMTSEARRGLFSNIAHHMAKVPHEIRLRVICRLFRTDPNYGIGLAQALGLALKSATHFNAGLPVPARA